LVRPADPVVEPWYVRVRLVAEERVRRAEAGVQLLKEVVEPSRGRAPAAKRAEEAGRILGHHPGVLRPIALGEALAAQRVVRIRVIWVDERTAGEARARVADGGVEDVAPVARPRQELAAGGSVASRRRQAGDREVIRRVLEGRAGGAPGQVSVRGVRRGHRASVGVDALGHYVRV